jgi:hypothetical protein
MCEGKILGDRVDGKFVLGKNQDCLNSWGHFLGLPPFFFFSFGAQNFKCY